MSLAAYILTALPAPLILVALLRQKVDRPAGIPVCIAGSVLPGWVESVAQGVMSKTCDADSWPFRSSPWRP